MLLEMGVPLEVAEEVVRSQVHAHRGVAARALPGAIIHEITGTDPMTLRAFLRYLATDSVSFGTLFSGNASTANANTAANGGGGGGGGGDGDDEASLAVDDVDPIALLGLAHRFALPRLVSLCEIAVAKVVERETATSVSQARISVPELLAIAEESGAQQLRAFLIHFASVNFLPLDRAGQIEILPPKARSEVRKKRWPPTKYFDELSIYRRKNNMPQIDVFTNPRGVKAL
jgi:hypothetical protein